MASNQITKVEGRGWKDLVHKICASLILGALVIGPVFLAIFVTIPPAWADDDFIDFVLGNYAVFFILPYIGCLAYFLVVTLEATRGPVEFEFAAIKIKGAGGPILFWVIAFVAVSGTVKMFWAGWPS
ncbi:hypothetical protein [Paraburkholderia lacunae]|uniref:Uncharacterized protein n=1 Tax=Paraburkholderia lacunae TaxID=2211104 RepID=A0A370MY10_9BURK|nr:hypothetical protein [Paraburkholderia lacunae]RDJ98077.1 hypothetical protein DLM46_35145 [Paraburkholderia lacunae]